MVHAASEGSELRGTRSGWWAPRKRFCRLDHVDEIKDPKRGSSICLRLAERWCVSGCWQAQGARGCIGGGAAVCRPLVEEPQDSSVFWTYAANVRNNNATIGVVDSDLKDACTPTSTSTTPGFATEAPLVVIYLLYLAFFVAWRLGSGAPGEFFQSHIVVPKRAPFGGKCCALLRLPR
ncbi:hypothetical protein PRIC1_001587 [Phytophthora ramorum]